MKKRILWSVLLGAAMTLVLPASAWALSFDKAVDRLVRDGYPQRIEQYLTSQGTSPIGFAFGGSSADTARGKYLARELRKLGFKVRLESVPLDVQEFKGASVTVGSKVMTASTFGGVRATPGGGITGEVVYAHGGTAADLAAAGDVSGKLVLIDALLGSYWMNWPWTEAALNGAAGIIYCGTPDDDAYYAEPDALGSFDAEYRYALPPVVYVSQNDGTWLKSQLSGGPVTATMVNDQKVTLARNGGKGYNVVATLPGSKKGAGRIVIGAHKDCYFYAGIDDTGGCTAGMLMAKALKLSHYKPKRSITFLFTTGEEYGRVNSYYDWLMGAWHCITQRHPAWAGKTALMLELESMAIDGALMETRATPELRGLVEEYAGTTYKQFAPYGYNVKAVNCWNDAWTFTAAGVPSIYLRARTPEYGSKWYHTNFDTIDMMDYTYLGKITKLSFRFVRKADKGVLPYDLKERADDLAGVVDGPALKAAGADDTKVDRLLAAVAKFQERAAAYQSRAASFNAKVFNRVNKRLVALEKRINSSWTALDAWDGTVYPHEQVLNDLQQLAVALAALDAPVDKDAALDALANVGYTLAGLDFSYENYLMQLEMKQPGWWGGLYWGEQGHLSPLLDVMPAIDKIDDGKYAAAKASLDTMVAHEVDELNDRIDDIHSTLAWVNARLPKVR